MKPDLWGPHAWILIHSIAHDYPLKASVETQQHAICFINSLTHLLPCKKCRYHLENNLNQAELRKAVTGRNMFFSFTVNLHNKVNSMLQKPIITEENARKILYVNLTQVTNTNTTTYCDMKLIVVIAAVILLYLYVKK